jgi:protein ImuB
VDRLACVDLPAFPLQLLRRSHPEWAGLPAAVVDEDRPQGRILWACEQARQAGVLPGLRYAQALALASGLRAGVVAADTITQQIDRLANVLRRLTPDVEPSADEPGVFWLSGTGLGSVFRSATTWGRSIVAALDGARFSSSVVVGFTRFSSYAVSKLGTPLVVFRDDGAERRAAHGVFLDRLGLSPALRDFLSKLGIYTVGDYLALPPGGLLLRFGDEASRLHQLAAGARWDPLQPIAANEPLEERMILDDRETDLTRLLFVIKGGLQRLLERLGQRHQALSALVLELRLDRAPPQQEILKPAEPTLDIRVLLRLLHLRFESSPPPAAVTEIWFDAVGIRVSAEQLSLFLQKPRRDLRAAGEALAQLRADLGNDAVRKAVILDGHLPESQFAWVSLDGLMPAQPRTGQPPILIRRFHARPTVVTPQRHSTRDDGWLLSGLEQGAVIRFDGPYLISGHWWSTEVDREYAFADTKRGECLWLYYDRQRRRWLIQGAVE